MIRFTFYNPKLSHKQEKTHHIPVVDFMVEARQSGLNPYQLALLSNT